MFLDNINTELITIKEGQPGLIVEDVGRKRSLSSIISPSVDIQGQAVASDILVALLDRPGEMNQLVSRNYPFYESIQRYIRETQGEQAWQRFQDLFYKPREKMPDRTWISCISHHLAHNSLLLTKFKDIVGYIEDVPEVMSPSFYFGTFSSSTSSSTGRRRSRRLSNRSFEFDLTEDESIIEEEPSLFTESMFTNEEQFYQQSAGYPRRRRSSCHTLQSEPHPTFVESKIDEVDEAEIDTGNDSDYLKELLRDTDDDDDEEDSDQDAHNFRTAFKEGNKNIQGLARLRDYPDIQASLSKAHPGFFRKAKQLLSLAPSSRRFSATMRRNSILEGEMPPSLVTEMDEPRLQTCTDSEDGEEKEDIIHLICITRRQQPDDVAWLDSIMEALYDWPELIDGLNDIINESLNENH
ncbi:hypothetical protein G6F60_007265 [Rhizopus arrhizus]|nr:hypothetical protein G6F24_006863 [Rhizopus arrhizus]KAG0909148.1 hypothetical protein G6F33_009044 [Rhizopus arrhizus]KAG0945476.1 hypothetical protein G6F32_006923 [Rhizopus arrhizus]KAG1384035.1 hypothetical protein G6F61_000823 [Rhizopus arrhizus]KAG1400117.1 hypothetical protein G6F60_007265 [Rhizopus arrhizus]